MRISDWSSDVCSSDLSDHLREKDGLWAVLLWLNILARRRQSVAEILRAHWTDYGRDYYTRHDYEGVDKEAAESLMAELRGRLGKLPGKRFAGLTVSAADDFAYTDPVDGSTASGQGLRIFFAENARAVLRLSGTGTVGATLRVYLERFEDDPARLQGDPQESLAAVIAAVEEIAGLAARLGRDRPDVRSEEHTSELQSLMRISYAVFCLKKKKLPTRTTV